MICHNEFDYLCELFEHAIPAADAYYASVRARVNADYPLSPAEPDLLYDPRVTDAEREEILRLEKRAHRIANKLRKDYRIRYNDQWDAWRTYRKYHPAPAEGQT